MDSLLEVEAVRVGGALSITLSFRLGRGEILGLYFQRDVDCARVLDVLAGRAAPDEGVIRRAGDAVAFLDDADGTDAEVVAARAKGESVVLVTTQADRAYRCDRVVFVGWTTDALLDELERICASMRVLVDAVLTDETPDLVATIARLRLLTRASQAMLREASARPLTREAHARARAVAAELTSVTVDDRLLAALLRGVS